MKRNSYIHQFIRLPLLIYVEFCTKGEAMGLFYADSRTQVAIKTVNDPLDGPQRTALLCEMKILSNLELHLNLVNMMGSCTSDFAVSGELYLLLEFCEHGTSQD